MPRPARKSSRNTSKTLNENGQETEISAKDRSRSPTPEKERLRERTRSGSTSSSRTPSPEQASRGRRGRGARGRNKKPSGRRKVKKGSPSSSRSSSPEVVVPSKKTRRHDSRSLETSISEASTRRSTRNTSGSQSFPSEDQQDFNLQDLSDKVKESVASDNQPLDHSDKKVLEREHENPDSETQKETTKQELKETKLERKETPKHVKREATISEQKGNLKPKDQSNDNKNSAINLSEDHKNSERNIKPKRRDSSSDTIRSRSPTERERSISQTKQIPYSPSKRKRSNSPEKRETSLSPSCRRSFSPEQKKSRSSSSRSESRSRSRSNSSGSTTDTGANMPWLKESTNDKVKAVTATKNSLNETEAGSSVLDKTGVVPMEKKNDVEKMDTSTGLNTSSTIDKSAEKIEDKAKGNEETDKKEDTVLEATAGQAEQVEKLKKEKKRKWGSKTSKATKVTKKSTSLEISSDSLKGLIGEVKLTESVFDIETEDVNTLDYEPEEDQRDIKVKKSTEIEQNEAAMDVNDAEDPINGEGDARTVEAREDSEKEGLCPPEETEKKIIRVTKAEPKEGKKKDGKKSKKKKEDKENKEKESKTANLKERKDRIIATTRPSKALLTTLDEPEPANTETQSPARNPVGRVVRIACLVRPFTVNQLKELLRRNGELDDQYFWINDIKSHCLAAFKNEEDAVKARKSLHGARWPQSNPKILVVDYATIEDIEHRKAEDSGIPLPLKKFDEQKQQEQKELEVRRKSRELREKERNEKEARDKREGERQKKRQMDKKDPPIREWDRDKVKQLSRSRSPDQDRPRRSRSRDRQKRREQVKKDEDRRKEKKQKESKADEEPPAKLLDDLFRKTKAAPCIYWLPLTEEQSEKRALRKQEEEREREKRKAAIEEKQKEEQKKEMKRREERLKEREKEREREREKERERIRQREKSRERNRDRSRQEKSSRAKSSRAKSSSGSRSRSRSRSRRRR